jgi:hypothetical protein
MHRVFRNIGRFTNLLAGSLCDPAGTIGGFEAALTNTPMVEPRTPAGIS